MGLGATGVGLCAGVAVLYMGGGASLGVKGDGLRPVGSAAGLSTTTFGAAFMGAALS